MRGNRGQHQGDQGGGHRPTFREGAADGLGDWQGCPQRVLKTAQFVSRSSTRAVGHRGPDLHSHRIQGKSPIVSTCFRPSQSLKLRIRLSTATPGKIRPVEGESPRKRSATCLEMRRGRLALVDTACTSCLRSKKWRESYQRTLPPGAFCTPTNASKLFHFADGKSSQGRLTVWRVPIFFGGVPGEVYSAEISTGTTPLLLSIPCVQALDMIILMRQREVIVQELHLTIGMVTTRTKHLAVEVAFNPDLARKQRRERPILKATT